jgi:hypothetical protein
MDHLPNFYHIGYLPSARYLTYNEYTHLASIEVNMSSSSQVPSLASIPDPEEKATTASETADKERVRIAVKTIAGVVLESKKKIATAIKTTNANTTQPIFFRSTFPAIYSITSQIAGDVFEATMQAITQAIPTLKTDHLHKETIVGKAASMASLFTGIIQGRDVDISAQNMVVIITLDTTDYMLKELVQIDKQAVCELLRPTLYQIAHNDISVDEAITRAIAEDEMFKAQTFFTEVATIAKSASRPVIDAVDKAKVATVALDRARSMPKELDVSDTSDVQLAKIAAIAQTVDTARAAIATANKAAIQIWKETRAGSWQIAIRNSNTAFMTVTKAKNVFDRGVTCLRELNEILVELYKQLILSETSADIGQAIRFYIWMIVMVKEGPLILLAETVQTWNEAYVEILTAAGKEQSTGIQMKENES